MREASGRAGEEMLLSPRHPTIARERARVRVLEVEFEDGEKAVVPRSNVEMIEE